MAPKSIDFWDKIATKYAGRPVDDVASWDATIVRTLDLIPADGHVLEVGCGTGPSAIRLAASGADILATDISPEMIAIAQRHDPIPNLRFEVGTLAREDLQENSYDAVVAYNLLHLLEDIPGAVRRAYALTKPGGVFVSKSACLAWYFRPLIAGMRAFGKAPFVNFISADALDQAMIDAGFVIESAEMFPAKGRVRLIVARKP